MREGFVHEDRQDGSLRIVRARRTAGIRARAPLSAVVGIRIRAGDARHRREAITIRRERPRRAVVVGDGKNGVPESGREAERFTGVVELAGEDAVRRDARILRRKRRRVPHEHEELTGQQPRAVGEGEVEAGGEGQRAEIERSRAGVLELDELKIVPGERTERRRVIHDLRDHELREILRRIEHGAR